MGEILCATASVCVCVRECCAQIYVDHLPTSTRFFFPSHEFLLAAVFNEKKLARI